MKVKNFILNKITNYKFQKIKINDEIKIKEFLIFLKNKEHFFNTDKNKFLQKLKNFKDIKTKSNFIFILRNLDFSLWKFPQNWQYRKEKGFFGLTERTKDLFNSGLEKIDFQTFKKIISPKEDLKISKLRYKVFRSAIKFLKKYDNNFYHYFEQNQKPLNFCLNLFELKKFHDYYKNLYFLKPNQLLYYEFLIANKLDKKFKNELEELTIFADYKIVQLFLNFNLIQLSDKDLEKIKNKELIKSHSILENELRSGAILIGEKISEKLKIPSYILDNFLWSLSNKIKLKITHPRVLTIFY